MRLLVLQPTPFCNLDCSYCYLPDRSDRRRMAPETLDAIALRVLGSSIAAPEIGVIWHGGEPMTLPPSWYEDAFARLAAHDHGRRLHHSFQTNGIGINDAWLALWQRWNVRVGVSLDGPAALHDERRRTRGGKGSFELTLSGIRRLQAAGHPFHVISVLTAESLTNPDGLLDFYLDHDIRHVCFNVEEQEGANKFTSLSTAGMPDAYRRFLERIVRRLAASGERFTCREIDGVRSMAGLSDRSRNPQVIPLEIVSVGVDGKMTTFSPEFLGIRDAAFDDFAFADVHVEGPEAMLARPAFQRLKADIDVGVAACRASCRYFDVCGGGAPANKYFELGDCCGTETLYCRLTRQAALEGVLAGLEAGLAAQ